MDLEFVDEEKYHCSKQTQIIPRNNIGETDVSLRKIKASVNF